MILGNMSADGIEDFWKHCRLCAPWARHPVLNDAGTNLRKLVGLSIHGDGCEIYRDDSYFVFSFSSVFGCFGGPTDVFVSKIPIAVLPERSLLDSWDFCNAEIAKLVSWSLKHTASGLAPERGFYGEEFDGSSFRAQLKGKVLAYGYRAMLFSMKGDLKARKEMHRFRRNYKCTDMCESCHAEQFKPKHPRMYYKDLSKDAAYSLSSISHEFYCVAERDILSPWHVCEGWRIDICVFDLLHNVFLGVAKDTIASALKALHLKGCLDEYGATESEILACITIEMRKVCKEHGTLGFSMSVHCVFFSLQGHEASLYRCMYSGCYIIPIN